MAIGAYFDIYKVDEYTQRVDDIASSIQDISGSQYFFEAKNHLKNQIRKLNYNESKIFKLLNVNSIEELNKRIEEYKKCVLNLSGSGLYQNFIGVLEQKNAAEYELFNKVVEQIIQEDILKNKKIEEIGLENAQNLVLNYLNQYKFSSSRKYSSTSGMTQKGFFPSKFTAEQKKQWDRILRDKINKLKNKKKRKSENLYKYITIKDNSNSNQLNVDFTWTGITSGLTETEAKDRGIKGEELKEINLKIKNLILSKVSSTHRTLLSNIIDMVINTTGGEYSFFVGKNEKGITGILGEIQGLFYLAVLLGGDYQKALKWRGGTYTGTKGKKPHQDILLENFGIQIKNSTKDEVSEMHRVGFSSLNLDEMLNRLRLSNNVRDVFLNYFGTLNFNVEYHVEGIGKNRKYLEGINKEDKNASTFLEQRQKLISFQSDIDKLFGLFSSILMYMEANELAKNVDDINTLFLIGGTAFITGSSILTEILKEIENKERTEMNRFSVYMSSKGDKNIISALNDGERGKRTYSDVVIQDIKLTSSYKF